MTVSLYIQEQPIKTLQSWSLGGNHDSDQSMASKIHFGKICLFIFTASSGNFIETAMFHDI